MAIGICNLQESQNLYATNEKMRDMPEIKKSHLKILSTLIRDNKITGSVCFLLFVIPLIELVIH